MKKKHFHNSGEPLHSFLSERRQGGDPAIPIVVSLTHDWNGFILILPHYLTIFHVMQKSVSKPNPPRIEVEYALWPLLRALARILYHIFQQVISFNLKLGHICIIGVLFFAFFQFRPTAPVPQIVQYIQSPAPEPIKTIEEIPPAPIERNIPSEAAPVEWSSLSKPSVDSYVNRFSKVAVAEMKRFGIPASISLAQGLVESRHGTSKLAKQNNNHFGIKCFSKRCKAGHCTNFGDDSHKDFFRKFGNAWESWRAHSQLLASGRYTRLKKYGRDYRKWAQGLQAVHYATDRNYADKLIGVIEAYGLAKYDRQ